MTRVHVGLIVAAHLADLATFALAVGLLGISGEIGPLRAVYVDYGGLPAVACVEVAGLGLMLALLRGYQQRVAGRVTARVSVRALCLVAAAAGLVGATTNVVAVIRY